MAGGLDQSSGMGEAYVDTLRHVQIQNLGFVILSGDVRVASSFYAEVLGFEPLVVLDWFASHQHPSHKGVYLDIIATDHDAAGAHLRGQRTTGTMIALIVEDATAEHERLAGLELTMVMGLRDEPWGQRRFQVLGPDEVVVEIIERIDPDPEWLTAHA
jgi:uncharacterized glyoxalase superfamily protein PhnB